MQVQVNWSVSVLTFYSDNSNSNPSEVYNFFCKIIVEKNKNEAEFGTLQNNLMHQLMWFHFLSCCIRVDKAKKIFLKQLLPANLKVMNNFRVPFLLEKYGCTGALLAGSGKTLIYFLLLVLGKARFLQKIFVFMTKEIGYEPPTLTLSESNLPPLCPPTSRLLLYNMF